MSLTSLVLMSGGLDSCVLAYQLIKEDKKIRGLYFDFGLDPSMHELQSVKKMALDLSIPLEIVDISGIAKMLMGYIPLQEIMADELDVGPEPTLRSNVSGFAVLLSIATYYAQIINISNIKVGVLSEQKAVRPNLNEFFTSWSSTIQLLNEKCEKFLIDAPFLNMKKSDVVKIGNTLNVPFVDTWSCYRATPIHCGECSACLARKNAFSVASVKDQTEYQQ